MSEPTRPKSATDSWHRGICATALLDAARSIVSSYGEDWPKGSPAPNFWAKILGTATGIFPSKTYVEDAVMAKLKSDLHLADDALEIHIAGRDPDPADRYKMPIYYLRMEHARAQKFPDEDREGAYRVLEAAVASYLAKTDKLDKGN